MRQRFEQQIGMGTTPICQIQFRKSRDELPPVLKALQHVFVTPELNESIFLILEKKICSEKKNTGRPGMDLWHILVLAIVRHTLNINWDRLEHTANHDDLVRKIMGIYPDDYSEGIIFSYQTIIDNVSLIDDKMLEEINLAVVNYGHKLLKKKTNSKVNF